jgi:hypothetical protein
VLKNGAIQGWALDGVRGIPDLVWQFARRC